MDFLTSKSIIEVGSSSQHLYPSLPLPKIASALKRIGMNIEAHLFKMGMEILNMEQEDRELRMQKSHQIKYVSFRPGTQEQNLIKGLIPEWGLTCNQGEASTY